ncbi:Ig-like domain-containing protein [Oryzihumus leptocrescens]|uniref:Ig-like domain-containing protein n=1 Tax=Oryzihumus leptocrescens TaxID=297536 RepID=UPI001639C6C0|nr:Ig-like domain-containing protein [Oryzihumus leptocrescens]
MTSKKRNTRPRHHRVRLHRHAHLVVDVCVTDLPTTRKSNASVRPVAASGSVVGRSGTSGAGRSVGHQPVRQVKHKQRSPRQPQAAPVAVAGRTQEQVDWQRPQSGTGQVRVLVAARPDPATSTSPVALYGRVKPTSATTLPTGRVCFYDGRSLATLGCSTLAPQANGVMQAHIKVALTSGTHAIVAKFSGDAHYAAAQSNAFALVVS